MVNSGYQCVCVCVRARTWFKFMGCFFNYNFSMPKKYIKQKELESKKKTKGGGMKRKKTEMLSAFPKFMGKC